VQYGLAKNNDGCHRERSDAIGGQNMLFLWDIPKSRIGSVIVKEDIAFFSGPHYR
jgi:hypothetical protein